MGVSDFSWNSVDDYLLCSVAEDNELEIWKASSVFYLADSDAEEPPLKRARSDVEGDQCQCCRLKLDRTWLVCQHVGHGHCTHSGMCNAVIACFLSVLCSL